MQRKRNCDVYVLRVCQAFMCFNQLPKYEGKPSSTKTIQAHQSKDHTRLCTQSSRSLKRIRDDYTTFLASLNTLYSARKSPSATRPTRPTETAAIVTTSSSSFTACLATSASLILVLQKPKTPLTPLPLRNHTSICSRNYANRKSTFD